MDGRILRTISNPTESCAPSSPARNSRSWPISRTLQDRDVRMKLAEVTSWTEMLAALRADVDAR